MSRRRRSWMARIAFAWEFLWRSALGLLLWPFYTLLDLYQSLSGGSLQRRSWRDLLIDVVLFIPRWIGMFFAWLYQAMMLWPRIIRLRDLAAGLPALIAAGAAIVILFFLEKEPGRLIDGYEIGSNLSYSKAKQEPDEKRRAEYLKEAQFYSKALMKLKPEDPVYRFNVGYLYQEMGESDRAQGLMDDLAPRFGSGFAKAHLWQADQLLSPDRQILDEELDAAEAHLLRALASYNEPEEIHRRLGELNYFRYTRARRNTKTIDPRNPSPELFLQKAEEHLSKVASLDTKLALTLAEIRAMRGRTQEAELDVQTAINQLNSRLAAVPDDLETRVQLAQAYRMVRRFADSANVIREGQNLRPNVRYDQELATTYYFQSLDNRQRNPNSLADQFAALQAAYVAYPANPYVAHRFVQALTSNSPEEIEFARSALQSLVDNKVPGQLATLLLGYDCQRRTLPTKAEDFYRTLRSQEPDGTAAVVAGLTYAVLLQQTRTVNPMAVSALFEATLRVWPNDPDLLMVRAQQDMMLNDFPKAVADLKKALERRPKDAKLHKMLAEVYKRLGQIGLYQQHEKAAADSMRNVSPPEL